MLSEDLEPPDPRGAVRAAMLQRLTARLARLTSSAEVSAFVLGEAVGELGASSGSLCLAVGDELELAAAVGYSDDVLSAYRRFSIDASSPAGECALARVAIYVETLDELFRRYPSFIHRPLVGEPSFAVLPLETSDPALLGTIVLGFAEPRRFPPGDREFLEAIAVEASVALERARANEALLEARAGAERARDELAFLADASARLAGSLDLDETLREVAQLAVPRLADRCSLYLEDDERQIRQIALAPATGEQPLGAGSPHLDDARGVGAVIRTGETVHLGARDAGGDPRGGGPRPGGHPEALRRAGIGSTVIVPLATRGRNFGALAFVNHPGREFSGADRVLGEELGRRAAVAIDNARLFARQRSIAETLQRALLPELPAPGLLDVAARYLPGTEGVEIGGDWFDVIMTGDERCVFVVGDVSGRGLSAATTMASLRFSTRAYVALGDDPAAVLERLGALIAFEAAHQFATVLIGEIDLANRQMTLASAGHLPPIIVTDAGSEIVTMPVAAPIGVPGTRVAPITIDLVPDAMLLAFTDGLVERRGEHLDEGFARLRAASALSGSAEVAIERLLEQVIPHGPEDDVIVLGIKWVKEQTAGEPVLERRLVC